MARSAFGGRVLLFFLVFYSISFSIFSQTNLYSGGTGNVGAITWYTSPTRTGATATPGSTTILNIGNGHNVTFPSGTTATYAGLVINENSLGGIFTYGNGTTATALTINGDIIIKPGGTLRSGGTAGNHNLNLTGHLTNDNIVNLTNGASTHYLNFTGSVFEQDQVISGNGTFSFERVVMNPGAGSSVDVFVNSSITVSESITFLSDGRVVLDANSNITVSATATFTGGSANRYIQVDESSSDEGQLIRLTTASTTPWRILYPIGTEHGGYTPLDLSSATITTNPSNNAALAIKILYNQSVPGQLRRQFRLKVTNNSSLTTFYGGTFSYNAATDVSIGDVLSSYSLVRYTNNSNATSIVPGTAPGVGSFIAPGNAAAAKPLSNGTTYFSIGSSAVWYTYQNGLWSNWEVWTQDPSGTTLQNPLTQIPLPGDQVIILNGFTVTSDINGITLSTLTIQGGGTLDASTTTGHNLGTVDGAGLLRINGISLPTGVYTNFVAPLVGGTVEYYNTSGILPTTQLAYNNLLLTNSTNDPVIFTTANSPTINGSLSISQVSGTGTVTWLINNNTATQRTINLNGNLTVSSAGRIRAGIGKPTNAHNLTIYGNIINNGSIKFFDDTDVNLSEGNYTSGAVFNAALRGNAVNVTFSGINNQSIECNGQTDFYRFIVDKGSGQQAKITVNSTSIANFRLFGPNNQDLSGAAPNYISDNALSIKNGTLELTGFINIPSLVINGGGGIGGGWPIPQTGALWLNSPDVTIQATNTTDTGDNGRQIYVFGLLRITNGTFNLGYSRGLLGGGAGLFVMEGGLLNAWQLRTTYLGNNNRFAYIQRGGVVNIGTAGTAGPTVDTYPRFALPYNECTFEMSGGTINVANPTATGTSVNDGILIFAASSNISVSGGTVNAILPASNINFNVCTTAPFYNFNISKAGAAGGSALRLDAITFNDNTTYTRAAQPLVILNNLTLLTGNNPTLNCNNNNLTVGGNFDVQTGTTHTSGTNTLTFNGTGPQNWINNGTTNALNNVVVNKTDILQLSGSSAFPNIAGLTLTQGTLDDGGKALNVTSTLSNSAIHTGTGSITATGPTTISGVNGTFGNLNISTNSTVTVSGNQTVTGVLRLLNTNSSLDIGSNTFTVLGNIYSDATTGVAFSATKRILTNGFRNDGGLTRKGSAGNLLFPVGTATAPYSPITINVTASTHGNITVRPVEIAHPNANPVGQELKYYWRVTSTGYAGITAVSHNNYTFGNTALLAGTLTAYKPARYNQSNFTWYVGSTYNATGTTAIPNFSFGATIDGEYTAGNITPGLISVYYSRQSGNWNSNTTWSFAPCTASGTCGTAVPAGSFPCPTCPVVIGDDNNSHIVTIEANNRSSGSLMIHMNSTLDCSTFTGLNFGVNNGEAVAGRGTLRIASNIFPAGDFSNFIGSAGGTVEWYGATRTIVTTGAAPQSISLNTYYNLIINPNAGQTITLPPTDLTIYNNLVKSGTGTVTTNNGAARKITIQKDFTIKAGSFTTASGNSTNFTIAGNTTIDNGATFAPSNNTATTHTITTEGSIINNGTLTLRNGTHVSNLIFTGTADAAFTGTNVLASTTLNLITLDKGTSQTPKLTFNVAGAVASLATGWLTLLDGNFIFDKASPVFTLQTAAATYSIPSTAKLTVNSGTLQIIGPAVGNAGDLLLAGTLEVLGGDVIIGGSANNFHNDIEYASAGTPTILVTGGSLYVNGTIRRPLTTLSGSLVYNQSGGQVTVGGRNASAQNSRGVFEIENNAGSSFSLTGSGVLTINRSAATPTVPSAYADIYINPETSSVSPTGTIAIGLATGLVTSPLSINIVPPIGNFTIVGNTADQRVDMRSSNLYTTGTLSINAKTTLLTNSLDVTIGGDLTIDGTYNGSGNTTTFNGSSLQLAKLSATSTFQNITINKPSNIVTLSGVSPVINNLNILSGTLDVANLGLTVQGNITNNSYQIGVGAIVMSGSTTVQDITSNNGSFTNLTIAGNASLKDVRLSGNLTIEGELTFSTDNRYLTIGSNLLSFGVNGSVSSASALRLIRTNGAASDLGVQKYWSLGPGTFTYHLGVGSGTSIFYTPVSLTLNVSSAGTLTVIPVNQRHPTSNLGSNEQILNYYWIVSRGSNLTYSNTGNHSYRCPSGLITGLGGTLIAGYLDLSDPSGWITSSHGGIATTSSTTAAMVYTNLLDTNLPIPDNVYHYTIGTVNTLPNPILPIFSRLDNSSVADTNVGGNWNNASSWTTASNGHGASLSGVPPLGIPVVILPNSRINMNVNARSAITSKIDGLLVLGTTSQHNLGKITGTGTLRASTNTFPAGDYTDFVAASGGTIEYVAPVTMNNRSTYNNVSFIGTGAVAMTNTDLTLNGSLNIASGVTVSNTNNRNITISRNWTNNGTYIAGTGTVTFAGTVDQSMSGATGLYNLSVNKPSGNVVLDGVGSTSVANNLTLTKGHVISSANNKITLGSSSTITGGSATSFISGPVTKGMNALTSQTYPLGSVTANYYRPASISNTSAPDTWTLEYFPVTPKSGGYDNLSMNTSNILTVSDYEYWIIERIGTTTGGVTLTYNTGSYKAPSVGVVSDLRVARWDGTRWDLPPGGGVSSQSGTNITGTVSITNVTNFSPFTLASTTMPSPLPVTWLSFTGKRNDYSIELKWQTSQETNSEKFEIERSSDGTAFMKVGEKSAAGFSRTASSYSFDDSHTFPNQRYYYRLKQLDFDGKSTYSEVIVINSLNIQTKNSWRVYPNPVSINTVFTLMPTEDKFLDKIEVSIISVNQTTIHTAVGTIEKVNKEMEAVREKLPAGIYILIIAEGNRKDIVKICIQ
ncbi:hypothetical protein [Chryseosolibacter indicus]|uniref:Secretion system C-terminal sorting domain-containing protein n=1 Tax=Chryseosolibacter indicus TaxID=2782351 RepID=A0ABS5VTY9_9BACT|nr:hypothetical protein [Chryseosolibacter indicus]MBT1704882.1 hypothetical protein [Chryseosolibacter indicus]